MTPTMKLNAISPQYLEARVAVIDALDENGPSTPTQIADATGLKVDNVKHLVKRMASDGLIRNHGDGTYGPVKGATNG